MLAAWTPTYGPASLLDVRTVPDPLPGPGEVVVAVGASSISAGDLRLRTADFPGITGVIGRLMFGWSEPKNKVQGTMFAGRVVAVGSGVTRFSAGDAVFGMVDDGAWAEKVVVKADGRIAHRPEGITDAEAAATPYGAHTALHFLRDLAKVQPGEHVLLLGASGGVGRFAIQLARHLGARVTAVGSGATADLMRDLGAHDVLDYRQTDFTRTGDTYDVIFDIADASSFSAARAVLSAKGRYLSLYIGASVLAQMAWTSLWNGQRALFDIAMPDQAAMEEVGRLLAEGVVSPVIAARYPLERVAEAHIRAESDRHGAVVVALGGAEVKRVVA